ncbi:unnamed protein product [Adineta steineri]|uniref:Uncharacterized protein n=1 Tax=Adineta steineri TaxID=433720 RepID=A0A819S5G7_9BILA|nr:unnamed protein product [Adineta steineri]
MLKVHFCGTKTTIKSIYYCSEHRIAHSCQIFFNDSYTTLVQAISSYSSNQASRTLNSVDPVYMQQDAVDSLVILAYLTEKYSSTYRR